MSSSDLSALLNNQAGMFDLDFSFAASGDLYETPETIDGPITYSRKDLKRKYAAGLKKEELREIMKEIPEPGETLHMVNNGRSDLWTFVPVLVGYMGGRADEMYGSTWTMSRPNALELLAMLDAGKIGKAHILTGTYFKHRESAVYATLVEGLSARGQRILAFENHTKVLLLHHGDTYITVEGSANFTANPRLEQYMITNDAGLYAFHRAWMDAMMAKARGS